MSNPGILSTKHYDLNTFRGKKIAIVGAGGVASFAHIPAYKALALDIVALVDLSETGLDKAQAAIGPATVAKRFSSLQELMDDSIVSSLDMIDLVLPSPQHAAALDDLLDTLGDGCPNILVQKPLAQTHAAATRILAKAKKHGCRLFINLNGRFVPTFAKAQSLIASGAVGSVRSATILNRGLNKKKPGEWRGALSQLILYEMAIHHFDFLLWTLGPVRTVQAVTQTAQHLGVAGEAYASVLLRFEQDAVASLVEDWTCHARPAWRYHPTAEEVVISGTLGTIYATPKSLNLTTETESIDWQTQADWFPDAFTGPMAEALSASDGLCSSMLDGEQHLEVLRLLEAAYDSASGLRTVTLTS